MKLQQWFSTQICIFGFLNWVSVNASNCDLFVEVSVLFFQF